MKKNNYFKIIHKYIAPDSKLYPLYLIHSVLVTNKALEIADKLKLSEGQKRFVEEAGMLHDIGIVKVKDKKGYCNGESPYICHGVEGGKILESEGLKIHALVAERHIGTGILKENIIDKNLPLPHRDMVPVSLEEKVVAYADKFYSKGSNNIWREKSLEEVRQEIAKYGYDYLERFEEWHGEFG